MPSPKPPASRRSLWRGVWLVTVGVGACLAAGLMTGAKWPRVSYSSRAAAQLAPTAHPPLPSRIEDAWLVPGDKERQRIGTRPGVKSLRTAADAIRAGRFDDAGAALGAARLDGTPLEPYVEYYRALVDLRLRRPEPARTRLSALRRSLSAGRLRQLALAAEAEAALSLDDAAGAAALLEELYPLLTRNRDVVLDQWATAARAAGRPQDATRLWLRLYYEFPTSDLASGALRQAETTMQGAAVGTPTRFRTT